MEVFDQSQSTWGHEIKEQTPLMILLYCGGTVSKVHCFICLKVQGVDCMTASGLGSEVQD